MQNHFLLIVPRLPERSDFNHAGRAQPHFSSGLDALLMWTTLDNSRGGMIVISGEENGRKIQLSTKVEKKKKDWSVYNLKPQHTAVLKMYVAPYPLSTDRVLSSQFFSLCACGVYS